jgi:YHYH protein
VTAIPKIGSLGVATNGIPIFGPTEGQGGDVLSLTGALSACGGHNGPTGYHFHLFGTSATTDCMFTPAEAKEGPKLFGYALDGYPIYSGNDQYKSSWKLTDSSKYATDTWSAHTYAAGSGDLDQCNGRTDANGNYAYYTTSTFPYVMGCFRGTVNVRASIVKGI